MTKVPAFVRRGWGLSTVAPRRQRTLSGDEARREVGRTKNLDEDLDAMMTRRMERAGLPPAEREVRFCPSRLFRFDRAYRGSKIAMEFDGGVWSKNPGRHNRGSGYERDCEKLNLAVLLGWHVFRFTAGLIEDGTAVRTIREALILYGGLSPEACPLDAERVHPRRVRKLEIALGAVDRVDISVSSGDTQ